MSPRRSTPRGPVIREADAQAQPLELAPLRFSDVPLSVRVLPPPPKEDSRSWLRHYWIYILLFLITIVIVIFQALYIYPQANLPTGTLSGNLTGTAIGYNAPAYVSLGDNNTVAVTILNSSAAPFTGTVILAFSPGISLSILPDPDGKTSFQVKKLPPGARFSRQIRYMLHEAPAGGTFQFQLKAETPDGRSGATGWQPIKLMPFSRLLHFLKFLAGSSVLIFLIGLFWERGNRLLFPD